MMLRPMCLFLAAAASLAACDNPVDNSMNELPYLSEQDVVADVEVVIGACDCLAVGQTYRFDTLVVKTINGSESAVATVLNGLWESDINERLLNIMMDITAVSETEVTARVYIGPRVDDTEATICAQSASAVDITFPREGCKLNTSSPSSFNVYSGTESLPKNCSTVLPVKHVIPVSDARLEAIVAPDCSAITNGKVPTGALEQDNLGKVCTCLADCGPLEPGFEKADGKCKGCNDGYQPLDTLLGNFGVAPDACTSEAGNPAACITAEWSAVPLDAAPQECEP